MFMPTNVNRCSWCLGFDAYQTYHDQEWGVPVTDDHKLFEFLVLESAQAGLSWATILKKRDNYRQAFAEFQPEKVARFSAKKIEALMSNAGIIRYKAKIEAAVKNAKAFLKIQESWGSFAYFQWRLVDFKAVQNSYSSVKELPSKTATSELFSKELKSAGFAFLGPTTVYAHMQATGMVNDHVVECFRHREVKKMKLPKALK